MKLEKSCFGIYKKIKLEIVKSKYEDGYSAGVEEILELQDGLTVKAVICIVSSDKKKAPSLTQAVEWFRRRGMLICSGQTMVVKVDIAEED